MILRSRAASVRPFRVEEAKLSDLVLTPVALREGVWQGQIEAEAEPKIRAMHQGKAVLGVEVTAKPDSENTWLVRIPVPAEAIADGVQTILINEAESDEVIGQFTLIAGETMDEDIRAEMNLLRAELDLMKSAFRRHCAETS